MIDRILKERVVRCRRTRTLHHKVSVVDPVVGVVPEMAAVGCEYRYRYAGDSSRDSPDEASNDRVAMENVNALIAEHVRELDERREVRPGSERPLKWQREVPEASIVHALLERSWGTAADHVETGRTCLCERKQMNAEAIVQHRQLHEEGTQP